ncbi:MAG: HAD-IIIC family phosphatase [Polyangiaceae bacterium]
MSSRPAEESFAALLSSLQRADPAFWSELAALVGDLDTFGHAMKAATLRRKAIARALPTLAARPALRLAIVGGCSLQPLHELVELTIWAAGFDCELFVGDYDNYVSEILDPAGALDGFRPELVMLIPSERRCCYTGDLTDPQSTQREAVRRTSDELLRLCAVPFERFGAEVLLCNFPPPSRFDLGAFRGRTLGSDWTFRRAVNLEIGLAAPPYVHICDVDFLATRRGALASRDDRHWFESKQTYAPDFMVEVAKEVGHLVRGLKSSPKKVLALDLDNTLWGGVIGDDGLEGIEIGDTSPRGEAFKAFQAYVLTLRKRGVLLVVVSKNDHHRAAEVFDKHPEMVLRMSDFAAFKANWEPKSDNLRRIAAELNLGLDSFVFVDDNPAEIEIVRQFAPEVSTILLGPDPAEYAGTLKDCRLFEPRSITLEDAARTEQYRSEATRRELQTSATDMPSYLRSLEMRAAVLPFSAADVPRITQLINKSNQFNLTTHRRTEAEISAMVGSADVYGFTVRLADRFGDHGLIAIVISELRGDAMEIETWVMSCRVLKRQVEEEVVNEMLRIARARSVRVIRGTYIATAKNGMVRDLYARMGFSLLTEHPDRCVFETDPCRHADFTTAIEVRRKP